MKNLDKFEGMNPYEIKEISERIQKFLRDHSQFIERVSSLSEFFSEYDSFIQYLKENQIIFQILDPNVDELYLCFCSLASTFGLPYHSNQNN